MTYLDIEYPTVVGQVDFSVCLYNLWVLATIFVGLLIVGKIPAKPLIPSKDVREFALYDFLFK